MGNIDKVPCKAPVIWAVVPAAGSSTRMGLGGNSKLLIDVKQSGKTILALTLEKLSSSQLFSGVVVATRQEELKLVREIVERELSSIETIVVQGGSTRNESVRNAVAALPKTVTHVAIHDGARPNVSVSDLKAVVSKAVETGAAILATPVRYTLKRVVDGLVADTIDRSTVWEAHTPQVFKKSLLDSALAATDERLATDDSYIIEQLGAQVTVVEGSSNNIKLTTPADLKFLLT